MTIGSVLVAANGARVAWATVTDAPRREVSRTLLRELLAPDYGELTFEQRCPACGKEGHGPIGVRTSEGPQPPLVSVSYAGKLAVVAVAPATATRFGIDAEVDTERTRAAVLEALGAESAADSEAAPLHPTEAVAEWTRLEALAKARGTGLRGNWQSADTKGFEVLQLRIPRRVPEVMVSIATA